VVSNSCERLPTMNILKVLLLASCGLTFTAPAKAIEPTAEHEFCATHRKWVLLSYGWEEASVCWDRAEQDRRERLFQEMLDTRVWDIKKE